MSEMKKTDQGIMFEHIKETIVIGAKCEMNRTEAIAASSCSRYLSATNTYALMLYLERKYSDAQDVLLQATKQLVDRVNRRDSTFHDEAVCLWHLAIMILREKSCLDDAENVMHLFLYHCCCTSEEFCGTVSSSDQELYLDGVETLIELMTLRKEYTKAEMLCRKVIEQQQSCSQVVSSSVKESLAQCLYEEAREPIQALETALFLEGRGGGLHVAACYHVLAECCYHLDCEEGPKQAHALIKRALSLRTELLGEDHPKTLESSSMLATDKLNPESEMIGNTRQQLEVVVERGHEVAVLTLENAQLYSKADLFLAAEGLLKRCWSISKLIRPEGDHKAIAESLADALFGQGKALEAKTILKAAGLVKKGTSDNVPASYLRWLNKRVAKYLDAKGNEKGGQG
ncbi:hypothetical protein CEUSTIGMA_g11526.t1 [Chlamydomonas eustigma]|uniref:MalT-like TPR region domain-containing protein n=1 Tax=Chlamydomonas eustigma TaxID=1157962 RepID=A0A250XM44_9CHLO|nr:hypothetical protein CEUSTIGMA_g11526.t1 [Chlamydomonas eustigma]|eukprot:GAX84103.1 hypothetical protein CEUSTIGMA_g11526.t1 [Chlamydomonas eustigma]